MAKDYTANAATALRLIEKFGRTVTIDKLDRTAADPSAPQDGPADPHVPTASVTPKAVMVEPSSLNQVDDRLKRVTKVAYVAGSATAQDLRTFTRITDGSDRYRIDWVDALEPGDTVLLYTIGLVR